MSALRGKADIGPTERNVRVDPKRTLPMALTPAAGLFTAQPVERLDYRMNVPRVWRTWVHVRYVVYERHKFGTQFPLQVIYLLSQFIGVRGIFVLIDLIT
jgi:hypothetical protein